LAAEPEEPQIVEKKIPPKKATSTAVHVLGVGDLLTHLAVCCNPLPGDEIIGYITRTVALLSTARTASTLSMWRIRSGLSRQAGEKPEVYPVNIQIDSWDR